MNDIDALIKYSCSMEIDFLKGVFSKLNPC